MKTYTYKTNSGYKIIGYKHGQRIFEHRYVMEQHLGRKLFPYEAVHHIDGNKLNNVLENLQVVTSSEHAKIHAKPAEMVDLICCVCSKSYKTRKKLYRYRKKHGQTNFCCSKQCVGKLNEYAIIKYRKEYYNHSKIFKLIKNEYEKGLTGYAISKKHNLNNKTVYNNIKKIKII